MSQARDEGEREGESELCEYPLAGKRFLLSTMVVHHCWLSTIVVCQPLFFVNYTCCALLMKRLPVNRCHLSYSTVVVCNVFF